MEQKRDDLDDKLLLIMESQKLREDLEKAKARAESAEAERSIANQSTPQVKEDELAKREKAKQAEMANQAALQLQQAELERREVQKQAELAKREEMLREAEMRQKMAKELEEQKRQLEREKMAREFEERKERAGKSCGWNT